MVLMIIDKVHQPLLGFVSRFDSFMEYLRLNIGVLNSGHFIGAGVLLGTHVSYQYCHRIA